MSLFDPLSGVRVIVCIQLPLQLKLLDALCVQLPPLRAVHEAQTTEERRGAGRGQQHVGGQAQQASDRTALSFELKHVSSAAGNTVSSNRTSRLTMILSPTRIR